MEFGGTAAAQHLLTIGDFLCPAHGGGLEALHEASVDALFQAPEQRVGADLNGSPQSPGGGLTCLEPPQQLQCLSLWFPWLKGLVLAGSLEIAG